MEGNGTHVSLLQIESDAERQEACEFQSQLQRENKFKEFANSSIMDVFTCKSHMVSPHVHVGPVKEPPMALTMPNIILEKISTALVQYTYKLTSRQERKPQCGN
jgi:hypothetical protein